MTSEHNHKYVLKDTVEYRDVEHDEFMIKAFICECGAGVFSRTTRESYMESLKEKLAETL